MTSAKIVTFFTSISPAICALAAFFNLLYMYLYIDFGTISIDRLWDYTFFMYSLSPALYDFTIIYFVLLPLFFIKKRLFFILLYGFTVIICLCNIIYYRFWGTYMPYSALQEMTSNFGFTFFFSYFKDAFRWCDIVLLANSFLFSFLYVKVNNHNNKWNLLFYSVVLIIITNLFYPSWNKIDGKVRRLPSSYRETLPFEDFVKINLALYPSLVYKRCGSLATNFLSIYLSKDVKLTKDEIDDIEYTLEARNKENTGHEALDQGKNCILIIVESFLSSSFMEKKSSSIIPTLVELKNEDNTYFNPDVNSNISIGESSDGQFIYMTGLLPLKNEYVVSKIRNKSVCGLASLFKDKGYSTMITIPTCADVWNQDYMSALYGFDGQNALSYKTYRTELLDDSTLFRLAITSELDLKEPFFHMILTGEMHSPYRSYLGVDCDYPFLDFNWEEDINDGYKTYLSKCHAMDKGLSHYLQALKDKGVYDNSVIIIVADHQAHANMIGVDKNRIYKEFTPLMIINSNVDKKDLFLGEINQLDLYPTISNLFGLFNSKTKYTGLGISILNKDRASSVDEHAWLISNLIIKGNYLKKVK